MASHRLQKQINKQEAKQEEDEEEGKEAEEGRTLQVGRTLQAAPRASQTPPWARSRAPDRGPTRSRKMSDCDDDGGVSACLESEFACFG